ncbi:MAG: CRTAC1 family protein [Planctomycetaceae bacterium]|nr:CRTAC1 family protein [Planctomycetaceae bacterium]
MQSRLFGRILHRFASLAAALVLAPAGCAEPVDPPGAPPPGKIASVPRNAVASSKRVEVSVPKTSARFRELTRSAGVDFTYRNGEEAQHFAILESLGGGAGLFDYDADGDLDLFLPGGGSYGPRHEIVGANPALYRNDGDWRFTDVTESADANLATYYSHGAAAADFDNDGFVDLLVTGYGGLVFLQNSGDGTFQETAENIGLNDRLWSSSAAWGDIDRDGDLDLYVAHYVDWSFEKHPFCKGPRPDDRDVCPPRRFEGLPDCLYENQGDGTFRNVATRAGLRSDGKGLGVVMADVDLDGDLDAYVTNDTVPNFLYQNDGSGRFKEIGMSSGTGLNDNGTPDGSMGVDLADFDGDGLPDLWVVNFERESCALYRNEGNCVFQHVSQSSGVTALGGLFVGWGTCFFDFDRDGDQDLFISNGHVVRYPTNAPLRQTPLVIENDSGRRFVNVSAAAGDFFATPHMGRGAAVGDLDDDGDLDLVVVHTNEPVSLVSNESPNENDWISLRLVGTQSSREPIGAIVRLSTASRTVVQQIKGGGSYASTSDRRAFFGLGRAAEVQRVEIEWPSGRRQTLTALPTGRQLTIVEP